MGTETWDTLLDGTAAILMIAGAALSLAAGIGLLRFPDLHTRMHAATKPQVLGLLLLVLSTSILWRSWSWFAVALIGWGLMLLTAPVSAHVVGRAGYRSNKMRSDLLDRDELADTFDRIAYQDARAESKAEQGHQTTR